MEMDKKLLIVGIVVLLLAVGLSGCIGQDELTITSMSREGERLYNSELWKITTTLKIENMGSNDVRGAELVVKLLSNQLQLGIKTVELGSFKTGRSLTQSVNFYIPSEYLRGDMKIVATIYLGEDVLDTHSLTW